MSKLSRKKQPRKAKSTNTLHNYFTRGSSATATRDIIVLDSDSDSEVEVIRVVHHDNKRQKLNHADSPCKAEPIADHKRVEGRRSTAQPNSGMGDPCGSRPVPQHPLNSREPAIPLFGAPRLLLQPETRILSTANPSPSSATNLSFGTPSLLLASRPTQTNERSPPSEVQGLDVSEESSMDFDSSLNGDDDWGMGDDEMAFAPVSMEPKEEEGIEDSTISSTWTEITSQLDINLENLESHLRPTTSFELNPTPGCRPKVLALPSCPSKYTGDPVQHNAFSVLMFSHKENEAWKEASAVEDRTFRPNRNGDRRKAPFYKILQGMPIAVDAFRYGTIPGINAYFLTHAHSDHYTNLAANWKSGPIYCSEDTANLIVHMLAVDRKWVHALPMDVPTIVPNTNGVSVTLIDANHCPGSCLFFFEGLQTVNSGDSIFKSPFVGSPKVFRYLHCGDFRASPRHILHPAVKGKKIDHVYLDTTYLDPKYTFPPQPLVISACADLAKRIASGLSTNSGSKTSIEAWMKPSNEPASMDTKFLKTLFAIGTYSIGKERIVKAVAQALESKVYCDTRKKAILLCQADPELHALLTSDPLDACVHLLPLGMITSDRLENYLERYKGTFGKAVGFRPTGWTYTPPAGSDLMPPISSILSRPYRDFTYANLLPSRQSTSSLQLFPIPYSEHSSFFELTCFAMSFDWGKMIATVNVGNENSRGKMAKWVAKWEAERKKRGKDIIVPYRNLEYW